MAGELKTLDRCRPDSSGKLLGCNQGMLKNPPLPIL